MKLDFLIKINSVSLFISKCFYKLNLFLPGRILGFFTQKRSLPFLEKIGNELLNKNYNYNDLQISENPPVFVMWHQGFDNLPEVINKCILSIQSNLINRKIILISRDNVCEYADIPDYILNLVDNGSISKTMFSDICRSALLYKNGGTWIDAAVFLTKKIDSDYFNHSFYSPCCIYSEFKKDFRFLFNRTKGWNISFQGTKYIHFPLYDFLYNFYLLYFKIYSKPIYYFMTDFCISLFIRSNKEFEQIINSQEPNNQHLFDLALLMNKTINKRNLQKIARLENTSIHKLTYKKKWSRNRHGKQTVYDYILFSKKD